jgi:hypothetical protein
LDGSGSGQGDGAVGTEVVSAGSGIVEIENGMSSTSTFQTYETFVDEGDIDMLRVLRILKKNGFNGV